MERCHRQATPSAAGRKCKEFLHCSLSLTQSPATEKEDLDAVDRKGILTVPSPRAGCHIEPVKPLLIEPPLCPTLPFDVLVDRALSNEDIFQSQMITSSKMYKRDPLPHASADTNGQCSKKVHRTAGLMYRRSEGGVPI